MTTDMSGGPGAFRRLMNKVATWSEALNLSLIHICFNYIGDWSTNVSEEDLLNHEILLQDHRVAGGRTQRLEGRALSLIHI